MAFEQAQGQYLRHGSGNEHMKGQPRTVEHEIHMLEDGDNWDRLTSGDAATISCRARPITQTAP